LEVTLYASDQALANYAGIILNIMDTLYPYLLAYPFIHQWLTSGNVLAWAGRMGQGEVGAWVYPRVRAWPCLGCV